MIKKLFWYIFGGETETNIPIIKKEEKIVVVIEDDDDDKKSIDKEGSEQLKLQDMKKMKCIIGATILFNIVYGVILFTVSQVTDYSLSLFVTVITVFVTTTCQTMVAWSLFRNQMTFPKRFEFYMTGSIFITTCTFFITLIVVILHLTKSSLIVIIKGMAPVMQVLLCAMISCYIVIVILMMMLFVYISSNRKLDNGETEQDDKNGYTVLDNITAPEVEQLNIGLNSTYIQKQEQQIREREFILQQQFMLSQQQEQGNQQFNNGSIVLHDDEQRVAFENFKRKKFELYAIQQEKQGPDNPIQQNTYMNLISDRTPYMFNGGIQNEEQ